MGQCRINTAWTRSSRAGGRSLSGSVPAGSNRPFTWFTDRALNAGLEAGQTRAGSRPVPGDEQTLAGPTTLRCPINRGRAEAAPRTAS